VPVAKEFTVKRSEWLRGTDDGMLLDPWHKMCCLGFHALACGFGQDDLRAAESMPDDLVAVAPEALDEEYKEWALKRDLLNDIAKDNDNSKLSDFDREQQLARKFAAMGITIHFED